AACAPSEGGRRWCTAQRPMVQAGRSAEYFDANVRLRLGEAELARLKARPERYAAGVRPLERPTVKSLLAVLEETYTREEWITECGRICCPGLVVGGREGRCPTLA